MHEPTAGRHDADPTDRLVFRRGKLRKREDDEVRMMREALDHLGDTPRVKRILLELSRFYNPVTDGPVVGPDIRRTVIACLEAADLAGARAVLEAHLAEYLKMDEQRLAPSPPSLGADALAEAAEPPRGTP
jgi:hypothetical protein